MHGEAGCIGSNRIGRRMQHSIRKIIGAIDMSFLGPDVRFCNMIEETSASLQMDMMKGANWFHGDIGSNQYWGI